MRTTINLDDDVMREVERLRRERGLGISAAVNELARRGMAVPEREPAPFRQRTSEMGEPRVALDDVGGVLELLEGEAHG